VAAEEETVTQGGRGSLHGGLKGWPVLEPTTGHVPDAVVDLLELSAQDGPGLQNHGVELDVEALERAADTGGSTADYDDVVESVGRLVQLEAPLETSRTLK
jgi:hypothetical protein